MTERSRLYACPNTTCPHMGIQVKVFGQLVSTRFMSWPTLTCCGCGRTPRTVSDEPPVAAPTPPSPRRTIKR
jgi:hypothetical protein